MNRIGALCCILFVSLSAAADVVRTKEKTYAVRYKDNAIERYKVAWTANVTTSVKEQVGSPVPYQGAVDFRRCSWTVTGSIDRAVSLATRLGPAVPLPALSKALKSEAKGADDEMVFTGVREETCKQATALREKDVAEATGKILGHFERVTDADLESLKKEAQSKADVAAVTVE